MCFDEQQQKQQQQKHSIVMHWMNEKTPLRKLMDYFHLVYMNLNEKTDVFSANRTCKTQR